MFSLKKFQPDYFSSIIANEAFEHIDEGPLHSPIDTVELVRKDDYKLELLTRGTVNQNSKSIEYEPGTIRETVEKVIIKYHSGVEIRINGVAPYSQIDKKSHTTDSIREQKSFVNSVEYIPTLPNNSKYQIEWLCNFPKDAIWPDMIRTKAKNIVLAEIGSSNSLKIEVESENEDFSRACVFLKIGEHNVVVGERDRKSGGRIGFIIYKCVTSERDHKKIRDCLGYVFGCPLLTLGYSNYSEEWKVTYAKSVNPYTLRGAIFNYPEMPPDTLGKNSVECVDKDKIEKMVNALYSNYDEYKLDHVIWSYWHSIFSPISISASVMGATIESLVKQISNSKSISKTIIEKGLWDDIADVVCIIITRIVKSSEDRDRLNSKIRCLNQAPIKVVIERIMKCLALKYSDVEKKAWKRRNNAAHGDEIQSDQYIDVIRDSKALRMQFNRIILKSFGVSNTYLDYYSLGRPWRPIEDGLDNI